MGLRAGAAQLEITPPVGTPMTGYILRDGPSVGVHDPLYARALVLDDGAERVALVICDVLAFDSAYVGSVRKAIAAATDLLPGSIMIGCTHTHSGPATVFLRDCGDVDEAWLGSLCERLVDVTREASDRAVPARIGHSSGRVTSGVENRRDSGGPMDAELGVLCIAEPSGDPEAILINYACHPTFLSHENRRFSADYPGYALARISERTGAVALFAPGAGGDIGPVPAHRRSYNPIEATSKQDTGDAAEDWAAFRRAETLGIAIAEEALRVLETIRLRAADRVRVFSAPVEMPLQALPTEDALRQYASVHRSQMEQARRASEWLRARVHGAMAGWAEDSLDSIRDGSAMGVVPTEAQVLCLDGVRIVGVPGEPFVQIGTAIKGRAGTEAVFVIGYANGDIGYIPTRGDYARGGYEIDEAYKYYGYPAALAPEAGEVFVDQVVDLLSGCPHSDEESENE